MRVLILLGTIAAQKIGRSSSEIVYGNVLSVTFLFWNSNTKYFSAYYFGIWLYRPLIEIIFRLTWKLWQKHSTILLDQTGRDFNRYLYERIWFSYWVELLKSFFLVMRFSLKIIVSFHLKSVSASDMSYAVNINLRQRWNDPRLDFKHERGAAAVIPVHATLLDKLWMPDLIFTNEKSSRFHNVTTENKLVRLSKNGDVYTSMRISLVLSRFVPMKKTMKN